MPGARLSGVVERVTDGDTVRVEAEGHLWKIRVLGLDTEESNPGGTKPVTSWGKEASEFAKSILPPGEPVTIEFPGTEPPLIGGQKNVNYLDNFQRPLGFLRLGTMLDGSRDYSEIMIRRGYSPYFVKYGRAIFPDKDKAYESAERHAQRSDIGVWNQFEANGAMRPEDAPRNYARLMVWWELRARTIDEFRLAKAAGAENLFNTRLDYSEILAKATAGENATVFMELTKGEAVGGLHYRIQSGSMAQPFSLIIPDEDLPHREAIKNLLRNRFIADGEDFPRRNYAYVTGSLRLFDGKPTLELTDIAQVSDEFTSSGV